MVSDDVGVAKPCRGAFHRRATETTSMMLGTLEIGRKRRARWADAEGSIL